MLSLPASSGDLIADRRHAWATALAADGDSASAAELMADALQIVPGWVAGWYALAEFHEAAGATDLAAEAYARALELDPADRLGAGLKLDLLRRVPLTEEMPPAFVETLFDAYAPDFERSLVGSLGYSGPEHVTAALGGRRFERALDLGCGTGLAGAALRGQVGWLDGLDISAGMLAEAAAKGIYDRLEKADIQALSPVADRWDLIVAADVLIYLGALERVMAWVAGALAPCGTFVFTVEFAEGDGFVLGPARRYAHSESYLRSLMTEAGFGTLSMERVVLRQDRGQPVPGLIVAATLAGARPDRADGALEAV